MRLDDPGAKALWCEKCIAPKEHEFEQIRAGSYKHFPPHIGQ